METARVYQLRISLDEIQPPIWRRIQVPAEISLFKLHFILQLTMGWTTSHLHEYQTNGRVYGDPDNDEFDEFDIQDERDYQLQQVLQEAGVILGENYPLPMVDHSLARKKALEAFEVIKGE